MIRGSRRNKPRKGRTTRRGGGPSASKSDYSITLHDNTSVWIHRPKDKFLLREGDIVTGVAYFNAEKMMQFKLIRVGFRTGKVNKLTFKFIHNGKVAAPKMRIDDKKTIQFNYLPDIVRIESDHLGQLAETIQKVEK